MVFWGVLELGRIRDVERSVRRVDSRRGETRREGAMTWRWIVETDALHSGMNERGVTLRRQQERHTCDSQQATQSWLPLICQPVPSQQHPISLFCVFTTVFFPNHENLNPIEGSRVCSCSNLDSLRLYVAQISRSPLTESLFLFGDLWIEVVSCGVVSTNRGFAVEVRVL